MDGNDCLRRICVVFDTSEIKSGRLSHQARLNCRDPHAKMGLRMSTLMTYFFVERDRSISKWYKPFLAWSSKLRMDPVSTYVLSHGGTKARVRLTEGLRFLTKQAVLGRCWGPLLARDEHWIRLWTRQRLYVKHPDLHVVHVLMDTSIIYCRA